MSASLLASQYLFLVSPIHCTVEQSVLLALDC